MGIASLIESVTMNDAEPCSLLHWLKSTREEIVSGYANSFTHQLSGSDAMSRQTVSFPKVQLSLSPRSSPKRTDTKRMRRTRRIGGRTTRSLLSLCPRVRRRTSKSWGSGFGLS